MLFTAATSIALRLDETGSLRTTFFGQDFGTVAYVVPEHKKVGMLVIGEALFQGRLHSSRFAAFGKCFSHHSVFQLGHTSIFGNSGDQPYMLLESCHSTSFGKT